MSVVVFYIRLFFTKSVWTAVDIALYDQLGSGGGYLEVNINLVMLIELMTLCIIYDS